MTRIHKAVIASALSECDDEDVERAMCGEPPLSDKERASFAVFAYVTIELWLGVGLLAAMCGALELAGWAIGAKP